MKHGNVIWFEIPVADLDRSIRFYSLLLNTEVEKKRLYKTDYGIFKHELTGIGGTLKLCPEQVGKGLTIFFYVNVISDSIDEALAAGGRIITPKTLLKQMDETGKTILAQNLIDNNTGYLAELIDSEGNHISLYSHC